MRRVVLSLCLLLASVVNANAGYVVRRESPAYTDVETLMAVYRVWNLSGTSPQAQKMVKDAHDKGVLVVIPGNTPIDRVDKISDSLSRVTIKGTQVFIMNESMECN